jgi:hypothetical protein
MLEVFFAPTARRASAEGLPTVNAPATIEPMIKYFVIMSFTIESTAPLAA